MRVRSLLELALGLATVFTCSACLPLRLAYSPEELRSEFTARTAGQDVAPLVVPHEITVQQAETARLAVSRAFRASLKAEALKNALFNPRYFGIQYTVAASTPAFETLAQQKGNCLAIAAAFVGLARAVGLRAFYLDVSDSVHEVEDEDQIITRSGHVTAAVDTETGMSALDFGGRLWPYAQYRTMDDLEATAHFHNNRGYGAIRRAQRASRPIPWEEAARDFRAAIALDPDFAKAWNNLGVAYARRGRRGEAIDAYLKAIGIDSSFASPRTNLGILYLGAGEIEAAVRSFEAAAEIAPKDSRVRYHLGMARFRAGKPEGAIAELRAALRLRPDYPKAQALLATLLGRQETK